MRARNWLLGLGLPAAALWSVVSNGSMPGWFTPDEVCAAAAYRSDRFVRVDSSWFPPRATCVFEGGRHQFISTARTVTLTVIGVLIALVVVAGVVLALRGLTARGGVIRSPEAIDLRRRRHIHLATVFVCGTFASGGCLLGLVFALFLGGPPGVVTLSITAVVLVSALAAGVDRALGPLPSTRCHSRRRGTAAAVVMVSVVAIVTAARTLAHLDLWTALAGGAAYVLVVAVQWVTGDR